MWSRDLAAALNFKSTVVILSPQQGQKGFIDQTISILAKKKKEHHLLSMIRKRSRKMGLSSRKTKTQNFSYNCKVTNHMYLFFYEIFLLTNQFDLKNSLTVFFQISVFYMRTGLDFLCTRKLYYIQPIIRYQAEKKR